MLAEEALFDGHPVAHVVAYNEHRRQTRLATQYRPTRPRLSPVWAPRA